MTASLDLSNKRTNQSTNPSSNFSRSSLFIASQAIAIATAHQALLLEYVITITVELSKYSATTQQLLNNIMTTKRKSPDDEVIEDGAAVVTNEEAAAAAAVAAASMEDMPTMGDDANHEDAHEVGVALGGADVEEPAMIAPPVVVVPMQQQQEQQQTHVVVEEQQQPLIPQHQEVNDPAIVINTTDENDNTMEPAPTLEERDKKRRAIGGDAPWNAMLFQLVYYKAVHGDLRPKAKEEEHKPLYDWMVLQRKEFKIYQETPDKSYLTPDQVKVLDHLQFPWNTRGDEHWFRYVAFECRCVRGMMFKRGCVHYFLLWPIWFDIVLRVLVFQTFVCWFHSGVL